jgi:branched-chain amino acid transport system permease protein
LGGLLLGFVISFVNVYLSPEDVFLAIMSVLLLILVVRPQGLLGRKDSRRV